MTVDKFTLNENLNYIWIKELKVSFFPLDNRWIWIWLKFELDLAKIWIGFKFIKSNLNLEFGIQIQQLFYLVDFN